MDTIPQFYKGVHALFQLWTALSLAVEQAWGGVDSAEKRSWLADQAIAHFYPEVVGDPARQKIPDRNDDIDAIEDLLLDVMMNEFNAQLEDDSARQVAVDVVELFEATGTGNFAPVQELLARVPLPRDLGRGNLADSEDEDDSDNDNNVNDRTQGDRDGMDIDSGPGESSRKPERVMDDDGFELVQRRKR